MSGQPRPFGHRPGLRRAVVISAVAGVGGAHLSRDEFVNRQAGHFLPPVAEHLGAAPVDQSDPAVLAGQRQAVPQRVEQLPEHSRGHGPDAWAAGQAGLRRRSGSRWRGDGGSRCDRRVEQGIDGDEAIQPFDAEHAPDQRSGDHQPELGSASRRPLARSSDRVHGRVVARHGAGHIGNQDGGPAVDHGKQPVTELVHVGDIDLPRERDDRTPSRPCHREQVIRHSDPSCHSGRAQPVAGPGAGGSHARAGSCVISARRAPAGRRTGRPDRPTAGSSPARSAGAPGSTSGCRAGRG